MVLTLKLTVLILVEKRGQEGVRWVLPCVLDGARAGPPEDCGGINGLEEILIALEEGAEEAERERRELLEWLGDYDPTSFDREAAKLRPSAGRPNRLLHFLFYLVLKNKPLLLCSCQWDDPFAPRPIRMPPRFLSPATVSASRKARKASFISIWRC